MTQHYTRNTVSVSAYCSKCAKNTQHRVDGVRKGPCLECIRKRDLEVAQGKAEQERQRGLFA
jgi:ribosomal protein L44E